MIGLGVATLAPLAACGDKTDDRFAARTSDEYTEATNDVVVGTPERIVRGATRMPDGRIVGGTPQNERFVVLGAEALPTDAGGGGGGGGEGGVGEGGVDEGGIGDGGPGGGGGSGQWHFDDCSPTSNFLVDSSGLGANAQHALKSACVPGISGLGVDFRNAKDVVQVPDEPQFTIDSRVAAAAWVHPNTVSGNQPIVVKRLNATTSFSLGVHNGNIEMSVVLATGTTVISRAPISAGTWTHVAGMYDGTFVFLFINGQQFGQVFGGGPLKNVFAPLRIGATTGTQFFDGTIDEVFVSTQAISKDALAALSCIAQPSSLAITPATSGPVPPGTTVHYDVRVSDNDLGACQPRNYNAFFPNIDPSFQTVFDFPPGQSASASPGGTATFGVEVTGSDAADPGVHALPLVVDDFTNANGFEQLLGQVTYELTQPSGCFVSTRRELMITSTSVVDDPIRTFGNTPGGFGGGGGDGGGGGGGGDAGKPPGDAGFAVVHAEAGPAPDGGASASLGVWSFAHLMREMAPTPAQAPAMVLQLLQHWLSDQAVNGFSIAARPLMQQRLIDLWPRTPNGELDLDRAPVTLEAIVNRIDIRDLGARSAGEGRFVFGVNGPVFQGFTIIVEYTLPAQTSADVDAWAARWHALSSFPFPSEDYNAALESLTRSFTDRGAVPGNVNGSALVELRTNENALSDVGRWELRGFVLSPTTGFFDETTVKETPDLGFNGTPTLATLVNANASAIEAVVPGGSGNTIPLQFQGKSFLGGSVFNDLIEWNAPGIVDPDARFHQSLNTCNGCHGPETNTTFLMITPRFAGSEATLSPFMTGTTVFDGFSGQTRTLNDLQRRNLDLTAIVCGTDGGAPPPPPPPDGGAPPPPDASAD